MISLSIRSGKIFGTTIMNDKLKNILLYTGLGGAILGIIGYILIIVAIVMGFDTDLTMEQQLLIAILGAVDGILINVSLRIQGISLAKQEEESKRVNKLYQEIINRDKPIKKYHLIGYFMFWAIIRDIIFKGVTVSISVFLVIYMFTEGNGDYSLFLVALANILLFGGFGAMSLAGMYNKYIEEHIPALEGLCKKLSPGRDDTAKGAENANN